MHGVCYTLRKPAHKLALDFVIRRGFLFNEINGRAFT